MALKRRELHVHPGVMLAGEAQPSSLGCHQATDRTDSSAACPKVNFNPMKASQHRKLRSEKLSLVPRPLGQECSRYCRV